MSQDRRIKERRSFSGKPYYFYDDQFTGKYHKIERRETIIKAGRRDKERRASQDRREKKK